jgi:hypothetical protein
MIGAARAILVASMLAASNAPVDPVDIWSYRDGHARPRALAFNADDGLIYAALSTSDEIAVVEPGLAGAGPAVRGRVRVCRFPEAVAALPRGGALVGCRFDAGCAC